MGCATQRKSPLCHPQWIFFWRYPRSWYFLWFLFSTLEFRLQPSFSQKSFSQAKGEERQEERGEDSRWYRINLFPFDSFFPATSTKDNPCLFPDFSTLPGAVSFPFDLFGVDWFQTPCSRWRWHSRSNRFPFAPEATLWLLEEGDSFVRLQTKVFTAWYQFRMGFPSGMLF